MQVQIRRRPIKVNDQVLLDGINHGVAINSLAEELGVSKSVVRNNIIRVTRIKGLFTYKRCGAITKAGTQCQSMAMIDDGEAALCYIHWTKEKKGQNG